MIWRLDARLGPYDAHRIRRRIRRITVLAVVLGVALAAGLGVRDMQRDACLDGAGLRPGAALQPYDGLTVDGAEDYAARQGDVVRVLGQDGRCLDATADLRDDRVNVVLENGRVVRAKAY